MFSVLSDSRWGWLGIGLVGGLVVGALVVGGLWPEAPLHAVATDRSETFAVATTPLDADLEAVILLDFLTGSMKARAIGTQTYKFQAFWETNVTMALAAAVERINSDIKELNKKRKNQAPLDEIQVPEKPRYLLVTGNANLRRRGAAVRPAMSIVYVVETSSGIVLAYGMTWAPEIIVAGRPFKGNLTLLDGECFRLE